MSFLAYPRLEIQLILNRLKLPSLYVTDMNAFDNEAPKMLARDASYNLQVDNLKPDNLFVGEKALIYIHAKNFNVFNNFW